MKNCPRCDSPNPKLHPAMQFEGEVQECSHPFHAVAGGQVMDLDLERIRNEMKKRDGGPTYSEANLLINEIERLKADLAEKQSLLDEAVKSLHPAGIVMSRQGRIAELETTVASQKDLVESLLGRIANLEKVKELVAESRNFTTIKEGCDCVDCRLGRALAALKGEG